MAEKLTINSSKLRTKVLAISSEAARKAANRVALRARASVLGQGRMDTLEMLRGFKIKETTKSPSRASFFVYNTAKHFPYQELGTPKSNPGIDYIYPKNFTLLRFRPKGGSTFVFAKRVRGVKPGQFLKRAAKATQLKDFVDG